MQFPNTPLLDDFNRAGQHPLGGGWVVPLHAGNANAGLFNQHVETDNTPPASAGAYWNLTSFGPDMEAYAKMLKAPAVGDSYSIYVRLVNPVDQSYGYRVIAGNGTVSLYRQDSGGSIYLNDGVTTWNDGDGVGISIIGSIITAWKRRNDLWTTLITIEDTVFTSSGYVGFEFTTATQTGCQLDEFGGGTIPEPKIMMNHQLLGRVGGG